MFNPKYLSVIVVIAFYADSATCDYYTSVSGLEVLLEAEGHLLNSVNNFMTTKQVSEEKEFLNTIGHIREEHVRAKNDSFAYLSNPISAFKLIKRFVVDWNLVEELIKEDAVAEGLATNLTRLMNATFQSPTEDDLKGAAMGLVRLQKTYGLKATDLAEGKILGTKYGPEMTASDCLELGLSLYQAEQNERALNWLLEALAKFKKNPSTPKELMADLLLYLSAVYFSLDNPKMAVLLSNEILAIDPLNEDALENKKIFEQKVLEERNSRKVNTQPLAKPKELSFTEMYEMTCRGERHQTPTEQRPLRCLYRTNGVPYRFIGPFKVEQLSLDPPIVYYHEVINDSQIKKAIKVAEPIIVRSKVGDGTTSTVSDIRTSKTGWLFYEKHEFLGAIGNLLKDLTGLSLTTAEALQIVNYGIGGHYGPHWDFSLDPIKAYGEWRGNRIVTALFYLNDVDLGGGTAFPFLKLAVPPVKGSLVMWYNLHNSLEPDFRMKHAGCPVLKGSKWILNEWFHERGQEFLKPCSLKQEGEKSSHYQHIV